MDFTENEQALKLTSYVTAAVWTLTAGLMLSPLHIHYLGWVLLACHLVSAFCAYCIKDMTGDSPAGWVLAVFCCPALAPVLMRKTDAATLAGAFIAEILFTAVYVFMISGSGTGKMRDAGVAATLVLWLAGIVYAARIAEDKWRNPWLWGIGCAFLPWLLFILVLLETDLDRVPGGWILRALGKALLIILTPVGIVLSKIRDWLTPVGDKFEGWFSSSSKSCGACGRPVSSISRAGGRCPHCGAYWSFERTTRR